MWQSFKILVPLRAEKLNKFLNLDLSQWCGSFRNPWGGDWPSWVVNMLLTLRKFVQAALPHRVRLNWTAALLIPELWQGQCIIYAELKPQEAVACCSPLVHKTKTKAAFLIKIQNPQIVGQRFLKFYVTNSTRERNSRCEDFLSVSDLPWNSFFRFSWIFLQLSF